MNRFSLQKANGNMFEFITHTANPISGICPYECGYCYMKDMRNRYEILNHELRIAYKFSGLGKGKFIFFGTSTDMFCDGIPAEWIDRVLNHCRNYPENQYLFQSKNPGRFKNFEFPETAILSTTIESNRNYIHTHAPSVKERAEAMAGIPGRKFLTIEPVMDFDSNNLLDMIRMINPEQVNIGADSKKSGLPEPDPQKLMNFIGMLDFLNIPVHMKKNLDRLLPEPVELDDDDEMVFLEIPAAELV
ncbi:MAG: DUF5131 family protein [Desulfococcaceae bacterium]|nr:DUF5131 family protein [Desulfococcaceae bacterium]